MNRPLSVLLIIFLLGFGVFTFPKFTIHVNASSGNNFAAEDFPLTLASVAISNASYDQTNLLMLKSLGVNTITLEVDYTEFTHYEARYNETISMIQQLGLKLDIINQMDTKSNLKQIGLINPLYNRILPPSYSTVLWFEREYVSLYASYHPNFLSVLAEPSNLNIKLRTGFSTQTWTTMIQSLTDLSKSISSNTTTLVDLIPVSSICDYYIGSSVVTIPSLDAVGWDIYNSTRFQTAESPAAYELQHGKMVGITETWWQDIYANSYYDSPVYLQNASTWFSWSYSLFNQSSFTPVIYSPFFSDNFITTMHLPNSTSSGEAFYANYDFALDQSNRTQIFYAYQSLIANQTQ